MAAVKDTPVTMSNNSPLNILFQKVAAVRKLSVAEKNMPSTSHVTGSLEDGTSKPTSGPTASEQKANVAAAAQANPIDGSDCAEGNGDKEHGLRRMMAEDKPQVSPKEADNDPKKLASLSVKDLVAKHAALAVPAAAQLLVNAATPPAAPAATPAPTETPKVASEQPVDPKENEKAAIAGAENAIKAARQFLSNTRREAEEAADLFAAFTKASEARRDKLVKEAKAKSANAMPPAPSGGELPPAPPGDAGPPMPPPAGGGETPMPPTSPKDDAGAAGGDPTAGLDDAQLQQLLMALLEHQGSADPKALEESPDPGAQSLGKQARAFLKQGKFRLTVPKNAQERLAIDHMKSFVRETTR